MSEIENMSQKADPVRGPCVHGFQIFDCLLKYSFSSKVGTFFLFYYASVPKNPEKNPLNFACGSCRKRWVAKNSQELVYFVNRLKNADVRVAKVGVVIG